MDSKKYEEVTTALFNAGKESGNPQRVNEEVYALQLALEAACSALGIDWTGPYGLGVDATEAEGDGWGFPS